jgi:hypothetical protein
MNPLYLSDFSRARIEKHYERSHPKQSALYNRALSERGRSAETNNAFFRREKITAHFARRDPSMDAKVASKPVGDIRRYCTLARKTKPPGLRLASI